VTDRENGAAAVPTALSYLRWLTLPCHRLTGLNLRAGASTSRPWRGKETVGAVDDFREHIRRRAILPWIATVHGIHLRRIMRPTLVMLLLVCSFAQAQRVHSFEGMDASQTGSSNHDVDPNGAVGTKQYMEWTNVAFQAYDKASPNAPVWSAPQGGTVLFQASNMQNCTSVGGDGIITFDHLALRWIIALRSSSSSGYFYCVAVSNTDDLRSSSLQWYTYQFALNPVLGKNSNGHVYWPDWPKFGTWQDAYYVSFDLNDVDRSYLQIGVVVCALDRTNMLVGSQPNPMQCFSDPNPIPSHGPLYLKHSLIPADVDGVVPPPSGRDEYLVSIQNPPNNKKSTTSGTINLWDFHLDWGNPTNSTFTNSALSVTPYTPGCYAVSYPPNTFCIPEPSTAQTKNHVDSVGDRLMPRFAYRNFGTYESFLVSHTVQLAKGNQRTGIRWYELRGSGTPAIYQSGTVDPTTYYKLYRFMPNIAQDSGGNAAVGYSVSSGAVHPGIRASWWNLPQQTAPAELGIISGRGDEENAINWGDYTSMTVDPVDDCTFWYVDQYFAQNETGNETNWNTRIANFKLPTCSPKK
jgi:hypothetical protein